MVTKLRSFAELSMPESVIRQIEKWAKQDKISEEWEFQDIKIDHFIIPEDEDEPLMKEQLLLRELPAEFLGV